MIGRRLPDETPLENYEPGDFGRFRGKWYCTTPNGMAGALGLHDVIEFFDGTITVKPSILVTAPPLPDRWHGYLTTGLWDALPDCVDPAEQS